MEVYKTLAATATPTAGAVAGVAGLLEAATGAGVWRLDLSVAQGSPRLQATPRLSLILGCEDPSGPADFGFVLPPWRQELEALLRRCALQGLPFDHEVQVQAAGRRLWARVLGQAVMDTAQRAYQIEGVMLIAEPQGAEDEALLTLDAEGRINFANPAAERVLGLAVTAL